MRGVGRPAADEVSRPRSAAVAHSPDAVYLCGMPDYPLFLYPFRYRHERTGKWVQARYRAELDVIRERHGDDFEGTGEPMLIRGPIAGSFNPWRRE